MNTVALPPPLPLRLATPPAAGAVLDVVRTYRRHLGAFLLTAGAIFLLAVVWVFVQSPSYTAEAQVVVEPRGAEVGSNRSAPLGDPTADGNVDTQVEVLRSPAMAELVVGLLHFDTPAAYSSLVNAPELRQRLGLASAPHIPADAATRRKAVIDVLSHHLAISRVAETFALKLTYTSPDPSLAAEIVNGFANAYVAQSLDLKVHAARQGDTALVDQVGKAQRELTDADAAVGRYRIAHNLMSVGGATLAEQQLTALDQQLVVAKANEAEATARLGTAKAQLLHGSNGEDVGEALGSPVIQELRKQRADASRSLADLEATFGPRFPKVAAARQQLADFDQQIQSEVSRLVSNLQAQRDIASRGAGSIASSLAAARSQVAANNVANVGLSGLELRAAAARDLYEQLLQRVREIATQAATTQADARIGSAAAVPTRPSAPNVPIDLAVGLLLAITAGIGVVMLRQGMDEGLGGYDDVEARVGLPYLASLPTLGSSIAGHTLCNPVEAITAHSHSAYAEGFRMLAAAVIQGGDGTVRTIAITSALPDEGKTTAAICLARSLALSGKRVVLIDADVRRPSIARTLFQRPTTGLREVIERECTLDEALIEDKATGASFLPTLPRGRFQTPPFDDARFDDLLETLRERFDVVLLDVSPVLPVVDGRLFARKADATIVLARWRRTPGAAVETAIAQLRQVGVLATGIALSRVDLRAQARAAYGDPSRFLQRYGNYYTA